MNTQVTLTLPSEMYQQAEILAAYAQRDVSEVLLEALTLTLPQWKENDTTYKSVETISDEAVLARTRLHLQPYQSQRLSTLLDRQQANTLSTAERAELLALMQTYQQLWLQQSAALAEAVQRGLLSPLKS